MAPAPRTQRKYSGWLRKRLNSRRQRRRIHFGASNRRFGPQSSVARVALRSAPKRRDGRKCHAKNAPKTLKSVYAVLWLSRAGVGGERRFELSTQFLEVSKGWNPACGCFRLRELGAAAASGEVSLLRRGKERSAAERRWSGEGEKCCVGVKSEVGRQWRCLECGAASTRNSMRCLPQRTDW
eukprot:scaffold564_cov248-Pinguiococcus_pyrenoidosus.AAC.17